MNRKMAIVALSLLGLTGLASNIEALGGTPPTPQCSVDLIFPVGAVTGSTPIVAQLVDRAGNLYLLWNEATPNVATGVVVGKISSYDPTCGLRWSRSEDCGGAGETRVCSVGTHSPYMDYHTNTLLVSVSYFDGGCSGCSTAGTNYRWHAIDRQTGLTIARSGNVTTTTSLDSSGAASYYNGTVVNWVFSRFEGATQYTESFVSSEDEPLQQSWLSTSRNNGRGQFYRNLSVVGSVIGICSGSGGFCSILDISDGSTEGTFVNGQGHYWSHDAPKRIGTSDTARYRETGTNGSTIAYSNVTLSTWTKSAISNPVPETISGVDAGPDGGWDVDANGDILMCGETQSQLRSFLAHIKPSNRTQYWNTSVDFSTIAEASTGCNFDNIGGIWWSGYYFDASSRAHVFAFRDIISGTDPGAFVSPTPPPTINDLSGTGDILPGGGQAPGDSINVIDAATEACGVGFGFDCRVLFGIFIVAGITFSMGAATKGAPLALGAGIVLGTIAAVVMGLFQSWVILIMAFIVIAVAGVAMFEGRRER